MNEAQLEKIKKFANDEMTNDAVFTLLMKFFLKAKPNTTTEEKAASFIAIGNLQEAWKEIESYKIKTVDKTKPNENIGL